MSSPKFEENEIVCVKDRGKIYEAKVLKTQLCNQIWKYFVHFQGWKRKWDNWTDEKNVSKKTRAIGRLGLMECEDENKNMKKRSNTQEDAAEKKRRKQLLQAEIVDDSIDDLAVMKVQVPLTLKKVLVDEYELIVKDPRRLLKLPRQHTVTSIIDDFLAEKRSKTDDKQNDRSRELLIGLRLYFDKALPLILLYRQERAQYEHLVRKHQHDNGPGSIFSSSDYYGAEHLLRLFVKLPSLSKDISVAPPDLTFMQQKLADLLKFIQKHSTKFMSLADYDDAEELIGSVTVDADTAVEVTDESKSMSNGNDSSTTTSEVEFTA